MQCHYLRTIKGELEAGISASASEVLDAGTSALLGAVTCSSPPGSVMQFLLQVQSQAVFCCMECVRAWDLEKASLSLPLSYVRETLKQNKLQPACPLEWQPLELTVIRTHLQGLPHNPTNTCKSG